MSDSYKTFLAKLQESDTGVDDDSVSHLFTESFEGGNEPDDIRISEEYTSESESDSSFDFQVHQIYLYIFLIIVPGRYLTMLASSPGEPGINGCHAHAPTLTNKTW